jgi:hypothetical protein
MDSCGRFLRIKGRYTPSGRTAVDPLARVGVVLKASGRQFNPDRGLCPILALTCTNSCQRTPQARSTGGSVSRACHNLLQSRRSARPSESTLSCHYYDAGCRLERIDVLDADEPFWALVRQAGVRTDGSERLLDRMHLPVGGRKFRPTLERHRRVLDHREAGAGEGRMEASSR